MKLHFPPPETQRWSAGISPSAKINRRRKCST
ncbi:BnaC05g19410D [Brassica napus]|uniref:BnaC05g19410D protein n=1 Tax=Brassica napus TaxID=3708 RepID=A0A078FP59_BRANA|nr:BnaC05g19410D [Brassica napus]